MAIAFTPPKQWEDWVNWGLGIWLCLSPWVLLFSAEAAATENAVVARGRISSSSAWSCWRSPSTRCARRAANRAREAGPPTTIGAPLV